MNKEYERRVEEIISANVRKEFIDEFNRVWILKSLKVKPIAQFVLKDDDMEEKIAQIDSPILYSMRLKK